MMIKAKKTNSVSENAFESSSFVLKFRRLIHTSIVDQRQGRKRATRMHCQDHQHRTRRGPDKNGDLEPYNLRGTIFRCECCCH